jgi:DNA-binding transcriptional LysR family regulator
MRALQIVLQERSVSRAALRLGVSQSALSHSLAKARRVLGDPLLIHGKDEMVATMRGAAIEHQIADILAGIDKLTAPALPFDPAIDEGKLVVTASELFTYLLAPALHARMQHEAPGMNLQFMHPDRRMVERWLEQGQVDFRLAFLPNFDGTLRSRRLFEDRWLCVVRRDHPVVQGAISLAQYVELTHLSVDISGFTTSEQMIDHELAQRRLKRWHGLRVQSAASVPQIIAQSDSIATLPARFCRAFSGLPLQFLAPPLDLPPMVCRLYWHERTHRQASHVWFRGLLSEVAAGVMSVA